ncbi:RAV-like factor [Marchantia polymorpha subsp. ruderalis]|uniref:TF-B3 domain-containing protein n=2 Tax=Marchantia polymorpha TaxID=3197 RepID=A0AAF6BG76_MARPO|nr:hypothetical protein MARPO_0086s0035 [Marchantia polymorpha]BBN11010.1 hypothetical protein Mp_5g08310 [Marchantia polymorpha subsp. ruderalis]|eukprot:PTQ33708.1 hypothetical protein MARPO_0086s0035 [Marchantia polymorpha]
MEGHAPVDHVQNRAVNSWFSQRPRTHSDHRGVKREMADVSQYVGSWVDDPKERQRISPEAEAGGWLRDEPVDGHNSSQRSGSSAAFPCGNPASLGSVDVDGNTMYSGTKNSNFNVSQVSTSSPSDALPSGSPGRLPDLTEDAAGPPNQSCTPVYFQEQRANLFAQLRGIRIKESVIRSAIERLGGGQKGLRAVIKVIIFWLRSRTTSSQTSEQFSIQEPLAPLSTEEIEKLPWNHGGSLENSFGTSQENGSGCTVSGDLQFLMNSSFLDGAPGSVSCTGELKLGDGEYAETKNHDIQLLAINEPGALSGMLDDMGVQELGVQGSGSLLDVQPSLVAGWSHQTFITDERQHRLGIRRLSPSPERVTLSTDLGYEDTQFHRNKIRRLSPSGSSSTSSCDVPAYSSISQSLPDVMGFSNNPFAPGGPFSISPSSPSLDHHAMDMGTFSSFGMQGTSLIDEATIGGTAAMYTDSTMEREQSGARLGLVGKSKTTPAAHTRLARKNRMDRNRRSASLHPTRSTQSGAPGVGVTGSGWAPSSGALRTPHSQTLPGGEGQTRVKDRRDMDRLQYLLQKMLKPSDVGNLGRIVLPKKDAESHLPWLGAREGIPFPCEDFDTGDKLNLRYRFWPNNKSRMYLLENTGEFVKKHNLEEGDRLMIYKNVQDDTFIIRGRKAQDCVDPTSSQAQADDKEVRGKEISSQGPPLSGSSSGTSSVDMDVVPDAPLEHTVSGQEGSPASGVTAVTLITSQDDLLNFADLPDAPMGDGTEPLVRFPSLEAFEDLLGMVPAVLSQQQQETL